MYVWCVYVYNMCVCMRVWEWGKDNYLLVKLIFVSFECSVMVFVSIFVWFKLWFIFDEFN